MHQPTVPPGGPGLFHIKGKQLPPYFQHLYAHLVGRYGKQGAYRVAVGVVEKWAKGIHPGGRKRADGKGGRVHADVQAAAQRNVAEWEQDKAEAHAHGAESDRDGRKVRATASPRDCTAGASPAVTLSAAMLPRAQAQYGLWQRPAATVSPSPPLPPPATIPTPAEVRTLTALVPDGGDLGMARQVRRFIETAAVKLEKDVPDGRAGLAALRPGGRLRRAQAGPDRPPPSGWTAAVFVPPAAQSSATSAMKLQPGQGDGLAAAGHRRGRPGRPDPEELLRRAPSTAAPARRLACPPG